MSAAASQWGERARALLFRGPCSPRFLMAELGISQPTLSRALRTLGDDLVTTGATNSIQHALRDAARSDLEAPIFRVGVDGRLRELGRLVPVRPEGFVMIQADGRRHRTDGLPWWLHDMRPQGFLGRAYNQRHGVALGLPARLSDWSDSHVLRALLQQGEDLPGNLLVGLGAREQFLHRAPPEPLPARRRASAYAALAAAAARGEHIGSSAGGEQPKFTACVQQAEGPRHVIAKFSAATDTAVSARWRDLLQAEHLALQVLRDHGVPAATSALLRHGTQRFLEVERFDREGAAGRRALFSLGALDAEFVGSAAPWPRAVRSLVAAGIVTEAAIDTTDLLWAFGGLIGNTDMHPGNLSFVAEHGRPYELAPAYDMTCMGFAPTSGGELPRQLRPLVISGEVPAAAWHRALALARDFLERVARCEAWSEGFGPCREALRRHVAEVGERIARLAA